MSGGCPPFQFRTFVVQPFLLFTRNALMLRLHLSPLVHKQAYGNPFYGYIGTLDPADPAAAHAHAHEPGLGSDAETSPTVREMWGIGKELPDAGVAFMCDCG